MDILNYNSYSILCSIALLYVKMKIEKPTFEFLYIIDYLLFNPIKLNINMLKNSIMYT